LNIFELERQLNHEDSVLSATTLKKHRNLQMI